MSQQGVLPLFDGVAPHFLNILNAVYVHQPETFAELTVHTPGRIKRLNVLGGWLNMWVELKLESCVQQHIDLWSLSLPLIKDYNFNVGWLENRVKEISVKLTSQRILNMNQEIEELENRIENLRKQVELLEEEIQVIKLNLLNFSENEQLLWDRVLVQDLLGNDF